MNVGSNRQDALTQAYANAKTDGCPRYLHSYDGYWWLEKSPPNPGPMAGSAGSDYMVVCPNGIWEAFDPRTGSTRENAHAHRT